jgi:hypothetical protein
MRLKTTLRIIFLTLNLALCTAHADTSGRLSFSPARGIYVEVTTHREEVTINLKKGGITTSKKISVETEKNLKILAEDYNFDGHLDFSISHIDDGMGTYTVYQIYVYSAEDNAFHLLSPKCGDEFINVSISKKDRSLTNSYFTDNQFKTCTARY